MLHLSDTWGNSTPLNPCGHSQVSQCGVSGNAGQQLCRSALFCAREKNGEGVLHWLLPSSHLEGRWEHLEGRQSKRLYSSLPLSLASVLECAADGVCLMWRTMQRILEPWDLSAMIRWTTIYLEGRSPTQHCNHELQASIMATQAHFLRILLLYLNFQNVILWQFHKYIECIWSYLSTMTLSYLPQSCQYFFSSQ